MFGLLPWSRESRTSLTPRLDTPFRWMEGEFRNMFDRFFNDMPVGMIDRADLPRPWGLELQENEKEVVVRAELPGFELNDLDVHLRDNVLTIEARHSEETREGERREYGERRESHEEREYREPRDRSYQHVRRAITLPSGLDVERIEANYRNGVLEVHVPRKPEQQGRRIEVRTGGPTTTPTMS